MPALFMERGFFPGSVCYALTPVEAQPNRLCYTETICPPLKLRGFQLMLSPRSQGGCLCDSVRRLG